MADYTFDTKESAITEATTIKKAIADSTAVPPLVGTLHLGETLIPDVNTTKAELTAAETLLGGYPAGGYTIADMGAVLSVDGGGAVTTTPMIHVGYTVAPGAVLTCWWIEDDAGNVRKVGVFDPPRSLQAVGDGFEFVRQFLYGRNV